MITCKKNGRSTIWMSENKEELTIALKDWQNRVDPYRSPSYSPITENNGKFYSEVVVFSLD